MDGAINATAPCCFVDGAINAIAPAVSLMGQLMLLPHAGSIIVVVEIVSHRCLLDTIIIKGGVYWYHRAIIQKKTREANHCKTSEK